MTADGLAGRLVLRPGGQPAIACARPVIGAAMMQRLTAGRRATLLPDLLAGVFTLCAAAHRATARRAVRAAFGRHDGPADAAREALRLALATAREHLQRLALDLPSLLPQPGAAADAGWVRDAPVMALSASTAEATLPAMAAALPGWLERRLFGLPAARWLESWQADRDGWLTHWSARHAHPMAHWLRGVREEARALQLPCRPLGLLGEGEAGLRTLARAFADEPHLAERPRWQGAAAETAPWTRHGRSVPVATAWDRLGARLADLATIAVHANEAPLACGALTVAAGEGLAWSEMSRGLLVHWVRVEPGAHDVARAEVYRVLAPTEWNFHPDGSLGRALAAGLAPAQARLAATALDPCVAFDIEAGPPHA